MMHCHPNIYPVLLELENHTNIIASATNAVNGKAAGAGGESSTLAGKKRDREEQSAQSNDTGTDGIATNAWAAAAKKKRKVMLAETRVAMSKQFLNDLSIYAAFANRPCSEYDQAHFRQVIEAAVQHGRGLGMAGLSDFEQPSADSIQVNLHELAEQAKTKLKVRLQGKKLSATTDHWISRARCNYATLTVHWIEDFAVHSAVLAAYMFKGVAVVDQMLEDFDSKLDEWGISKSVPYVVTDTEEKLNKFGEMVYEQLGIEQINCIDYSLQLVADIALDGVLHTDDKDLEECCDELSDFDDEDMEDDGGSAVDDKDKDAGVSEDDKKQKAIDTKCTLRKCRGIVGYFGRSTEATNQLKKLQIQDDDLFDDDMDERNGSLELIPDAVPRWWSTLAMVDRLLILKGPLGLFESIHGFRQRCRGKKKGKKQVPVEMPTKQESETLETLRKLLKPLEAAQKILEGSKYVTSSLVLYIVHVIHGELVALSELTGRTNENISSMASKMLEMFEQQFGSDLGEPFIPTIERQVDKKHGGLSKVYIFAHALDPRFKSMAAVATKDRQSAIWDALHKEMVALGPPKPQGACTALSSCDAQIDPADKNEDPDEKSSWASGSKFDVYAAAQPPNESDAVDHDKWRLQCKTEIMAYQREPGLGLTKKNENPLIWWKEHSVSYPTLWRLAEIYLAVPATAAKSERAFSIQGSIATMRRCQSKTDTSADCHFLHENAWILDDE
jgi:hAT family C-terminal dimerisation region